MFRKADGEIENGGLSTSFSDSTTAGRKSRMTLESYMHDWLERDRLERIASRQASKPSVPAAPAKK